MSNNILGVPPPTHNPTAVAQSQPAQIKDGVNQQTSVVQAKNDKKVKEEKEKKQQKRQNLRNDEDEEETQSKPLITGSNITLVQTSFNEQKVVSKSKGYSTYKQNS
jgi:hypothetical protein